MVRLAYASALSAFFAQQRELRRRVNATILETQRLRLREMSLGDLDFIAEMLADSDGMRFYPKLYSREESQEWIERQLQRYAKDGHGLWLVVDRASSKPVGQVGLIMQEVEGSWQPEIGYLVHKHYWRRGYASEAALGVREYAFNVRGKGRVISLIRPENIPSQAVARKLGMAPERSVDFKGLEHIVFAVSRSAVSRAT